MIRVFVVFQMGWYFFAGKHVCPGLRSISNELALGFFWKKPLNSTAGGLKTRSFAFLFVKSPFGSQRFLPASMWIRVFVVFQMSWYSVFLDWVARVHIFF